MPIGAGTSGTRGKTEARAGNAILRLRDLRVVRPLPALPPEAAGTGLVLRTELETPKYSNNRLISIYKYYHFGKDRPAPVSCSLKMTIFPLEWHAIQAFGQGEKPEAPVCMVFDKVYPLHPSP